MNNQREILFRGFHPCENGDTTIYVEGEAVKGRWVYGCLLVDNANCSAKQSGKCYCPHNGSLAYIFEWQDGLHEYEEIEVIPSTIGQYTGLTDKNGRKIFEGDILDEEKYEFRVVYEKERAKFKLQHDNKAIQYPEWNRGTQMKIIGTIWDKGRQDERD